MKIQNLFLTFFFCVFTIHAFAQVDLFTLKATIPDNDLELLNKSLPPHLKIDETGKVLQSLDKSQLPLLDSLSIYFWITDTANWQLNYKENNFVYDSQGFVQECDNYLLNINTGTVDLHGHFFYNYNNIGLLTNKTEMVWNGTNWDSARVHNYQYNAAGYVTLYEVHDYDVATAHWFSTSVAEYNYDANNHLTLYQSAYYDDISAGLLNSIKLEFIYDNTGKMKCEKSYNNWNTSINNWSSITKDSIFYDTNEFVDYTIHYNLNNGTWIKSLRNLVTNNNNGNPLEIKTQILTTNQTWENYQREVYTYDSDNNVKTWRYAEFWNGNQWELGREKTYVFTSFDVKEIITSRRWENNNWRRYAKMDYDFDAYENETRMESLFYYDIADTTVRTGGRLEEYFYSLHTVNTNNIKEGLIKIYPNPTSESISLELPATVNNGMISIWDTQGRLVRQENYTQNLIDVSTLNSGNYWLQITSDNINQTIQFIKN